MYEPVALSPRASRQKLFTAKCRQKNTRGEEEGTHGRKAHMGGRRSWEEGGRRGEAKDTRRGGRHSAHSYARTRRGQELGVRVL